MNILSRYEPILVVDIGNTNIVCAIYRQGKSVWTVRLKSCQDRTSDEYYVLLSELMASSSSSEDIIPTLKDIRYIALGSVVPELTRVWKHLFGKYFSAEVYEINALSPLGISFRVDNPSFIGADLIANAYAAWQKYEKSCLIIDLGTATTIELISDIGMFEGAVIAPGMKTAAENLFSKAAQLYEIELVPPSALLGINTSEAMLSGIVNGHSFMLTAFIAKIKEQYPVLKPIQTVLTGGMASLVNPFVQGVDVIDKGLTLDGFYLALGKILNYQQ
ncbi:MAG: type III pantothenate kinase [Candidatus Cloacimonas sp.]